MQTLVRCSGGAGGLRTSCIIGLYDVAPLDIVAQDLRG